jgi:uncharacterized membrane protein YvlD (DUF360 family)
VTARSPGRPRLHLGWLVAAWMASALALLLAAGIVPGAEIRDFAGAVAVAAVVAVLNAVFPPVVAALRIPFTVAAGFVLVLVLDAAMLLLAADILPGLLHVDDFAAALAVAVIAAGLGVMLSLLAGVDDDAYALRVARRVARRVGRPVVSDAPGMLFLEIDGLALPVLRRAIRDGTTPNLARWLESGGHRLAGWETDLSSQTGASQAGILLGDNHDIPAFRWVDKASRTLVTCSNPQDCAAIEREREHAGRGLLRGGGTSRGNLLSGGADAAILTASRLADERSPNPGYRAFLANGSNVTRTLALALWEVGVELVAAAQQRRRDVRPRGHRGGKYPLIRAGMCVVIRDLLVFSVLQDMFRGVPAVYATFAGYDEVAHHSGLERPDTLEALRKLDRCFGLLERARRYAPRPYEIVVLSDHGQTQGASFRQRNGYGLDELVERSLSRGSVAGVEAGDENATGVDRAFDEATGRTGRARTHDRRDVDDRDVVVLGSGNLGLVYLMEQPGRMTLEQIEERHPALIRALCEHPHIGFVLVRSAAEGALAIGAGGRRRLSDDAVVGADPLDGFPPNAARHLRRVDCFPHVADLVVNSFYDPVTEEGCAFEELISFHGGMGGPQTQPFILHPSPLPMPAAPLVGAEAVNRLLRSWLEAGLCGPPREGESRPSWTGAPTIG